MLEDRKDIERMWAKQTYNLLEHKKLISTSFGGKSGDNRQRSILGEKDVVRTVNELHRAAAQAKPFFDQALIEISKLSKFPIKTPVVNNDGWEWWEQRDAFDEYAPYLILMPLKSKERIREKSQSLYKYNTYPSFSWVYDVLRGSFICSSETQIVYMVNLIQSDPRFKLLTMKNRFQRPAYTVVDDFGTTPSVRLTIALQIDLYTKGILDLESFISHRISIPVIEAFEEYEAMAVIFQIAKEWNLREQILVAIIHVLRLQIQGYTNTNTNTSQSDSQSDDQEALSTQHSLAHILTERASVLKTLDRLPEALDSISDAIKLYEKTNKESYHHHTKALIIQARLLCALGRIEEALPVAERIYEIQCKSLGTLHPDTLIGLDCLAHIIFELRQWERAKNFFEELLRGWMLLEGDCEEASNALFCIGECYENLQLMDAALINFQRSYEMRIDVFGGEEHLLVAECLCASAEILNLLGRFIEALELFQKALNIKKILLGEDSIEVIELMDAIGGVLNELDIPEEANKYYESAIKIAEKIYIPNSLEIASLYNNYAESLLVDNKPNISILYFEKSLIIRQNLLAKKNEKSSNISNTLQETDSSIIHTLHGIWQCFEHTGYDYSISISYERKALSLLAKDASKVGDYVVHTKAMLYSDSANDFRDIGKFEKALRVLQEANRLLEGLYFDSHPALAIIKNNIGVIYEDQNDFPKALEYYQQAIHGTSQSYGPEHPIVLAIRSNYATILRHMGRVEEALEEFQGCLVTRLMKMMINFNEKDRNRTLMNFMPHLSSSGGATSSGNITSHSDIHKNTEETIELALIDILDPEVPALLHNIGQCYRALALYDDAKYCLEKAVLLRLRLQGEDHPDYATTLNSLGIILLENKQNNHALLSFDKSLAIRLNIFERAHPFVALALNNIGVAQFIMKDNAAAGSNLDESLNIRLKLVGEKEPEVRVAMHNLAELFASQGEHKTTKDLQKKMMSLPEYKLHSFDNNEKFDDIFIGSRFTSQRHLKGTVEGLLSRYASQLWSERKHLEVVELYRLANRPTDAVQYISEIAEQEARNNVKPSLAKKLYVLSALEATLMGGGTTDGGGGGTIAETTAATIDTLMMTTLDTQNTTTQGLTEGGTRKAKKAFSNAWRGAAAYHFFMLAQRQFYQGNIDAAMKTSIKLCEYDDILDPRDIYSLLALTSLTNKFYGICSKAFVKLETLSDLPEKVRDDIETLAVKVFVRHTPSDPAGLPEPYMKCLSLGKSFKACVVSGRAIQDSPCFNCKTCHHPMLEHERPNVKHCPLCHTLIAPLKGTNFDRY
eukprot:gene5597-11283_t